MANKPNPAALVPTARITQAILVLRGQKVLLDADLAALYGVTTGRFNEASNATSPASRPTSCFS